MLDLFLFSLQHLVMALAFWTTVFVLAVVAAAVPGTSWALGRVRRARAAGVTAGGGVTWLLATWVLVVLYIVPVGLAVVHAVPFAAGRSLAHTLETSTPKAAKWMVDLAGPNVMTLLDVAGEQVIVDADALREKAAGVLDEAGARARRFVGPGRVRELATSMMLAALHDELAGLAPDVRQITWHDVMARVKSSVAGGTRVVVADTALGLRATAWAALFTGLMLLLACHVATILVFVLAVRPSSVEAGGHDEAAGPPVHL